MIQKTEIAAVQFLFSAQLAHFSQSKGLYFDCRILEHADSD